MSFMSWELLCVTCSALPALRYLLCVICSALPALRSAFPNALTISGILNRPRLRTRRSSQRRCLGIALRCALCYLVRCQEVIPSRKS